MLHYSKNCTYLQGYVSLVGLLMSQLCLVSMVVTSSSVYYVFFKDIATA